MKILHITNWNYSKKNPESFPFIKEHFEALQLFCENKLIHVEVVYCKKSWFKIEKETLSIKEDSIIVYSRFAQNWRIKELLSHYTLLRFLKKIKVNQSYDLINIHKAYPLVTYTNKLLSFLKIPLVFTEHWTAFHFNFNLPKKTNKLNQIKKIYNSNTPVITVSKALGYDIRQFSKNKSLINYVVPNVVNSEIFKFKNKPITQEPVFYMLNHWRTIKSPFILFDVFQLFLKKNHLSLLIFGRWCIVG